MTRDDVIKMAREAGAAKFVHERDDKQVEDETNLLVSVKFVERFAQLVAAHEREECAKVCDEESRTGLEYADRRCAADLAADISARGTA